MTGNRFHHSAAGTTSGNAVALLAGLIAAVSNYDSGLPDAYLRSAVRRVFHTMTGVLPTDEEMMEMGVEP